MAGLLAEVVAEAVKVTLSPRLIVVADGVRVTVVG
jgi:hypothetical protein